MDSAVTAALVGGGVALLASAGAWYTTNAVTKETLAQNASELATKLKDERDASREEREQERLKEAYVTLLKYVFWLQDVNAIRQRIVARQYTAITNLRTEEDSPEGQEEKSAIDAFVDAGANEREKRRLEAGPTYEDNAATWALVKAVSSDAVLAAFEGLMKRDDVFWSRQRDVESALLHEPRAASGKDAATQKLTTTERLLTAIGRMVQAGKGFNSAAETLATLVRAELKQPRSASRNRRTPTAAAPS